MTRRTILSVVCVTTLGMALIGPTAVTAQVIREMTEEELVDYLRLLRFYTQPEKRSSIFGVDTAFALGANSAAASLSGTNRIGRSGATVDGSATLSFGFGDAIERIGGQVTIDVTSLTDDFADSGSLSLKFTRRISQEGDPVYAGLTLGRLAPWGDSVGLDPAVTATISTVRTLSLGKFGDPYPIQISGGYSNALSNNGKDPGAFLGIGIGLSPQFAVSAAWAGDEAIFGATLFPTKDGNIQISAGIGDAFNQVGGQRFIFTIGVSSFDIFKAGK